MNNLKTTERRPEWTFGLSLAYAICKNTPEAKWINKFRNNQEDFYNCAIDFYKQKLPQHEGTELQKELEAIITRFEDDKDNFIFSDEEIKRCFETVRAMKFYGKTASKLLKSKKGVR